MTAPDGPVLAIDTASAEATLGVVTGEEVTSERRWTVETNYSRELLAGIDAVLRDAGVMRDDLAAVAVDAGPGGYGGLRSGVATAQGLAFALDLPLAGVSRLELAALPHLDEERPVVAVHAAGGNRVAWA
ncbi:MAG: tRNA (adenosine(37)-N6)-threonylcarbamoyltransferase complex dimerization subunit type 1 TsaB, partial [Chloroflexi bacterium]|nr:tRNA (adenosine(37)-N6)-threonylcarbamoyltransferase complex dimerization subunit type 1 TsaB [Chloroflexota bacterium]